MKFFIILLVVPSLSLASVIKVMHYNIKELDSTKIKNDSNQINQVKSIIRKYNIDILSLNEIQYDKVSVPNQQYKTTGENVAKLKEKLGLDKLNYAVFGEANTGKNAKTKHDGSYYALPNSIEARKHADPINFGTMPGQYSTGALFKYKIVKKVVINDLRWRDFNPAINLANFKTAGGKELPKDMELFDKNFTDVTLSIDNKEVHVILLHTVPSFHFGNKFSVNYKRNADQLRFLEWYITGSTDFKVNISGLSHLKKGAYYIAMGDFNISPNAKDEGATVINNILDKTNPWIAKKDMTFTNESSTYNKNPSRLMLDYIISSKNIIPSKGQILHPNFFRAELGCSDKNLAKHTTKDDMIIVNYTENARECSALIHKEYRNFKEASDHYPLYGEFTIK
jgi:endonuclease/exonuclease/phosphatase family metal-dependent hydrolase